MSESARPEFSYRLLIATTDLIGQTARRTLAGQEKPAGLLLRSQLAEGAGAMAEKRHRVHRARGEIAAGSEHARPDMRRVAVDGYVRASDARRDAKRASALGQRPKTGDGRRHVQHQFVRARAFAPASGGFGTEVPK
jgi:hypothetical protein